MFSRILVSAGGTREPWDEVRFLGNRSTGRQGCEIARAGLELGAEVTLVAANVEAALIPQGLHVIPVETAEETLQAMLHEAPRADLVVMCAAVADFKPVRVWGKITRHDREIPTITLQRTPDVLLALLEQRNQGIAPTGQVIVGFGAITGTQAEVEAKGAAKAQAKRADLLAVNQVGQGAATGFGVPNNSLIFFDAEGRIRGRGRGTKFEVGKILLQTAGKFQENSLECDL